MIDTKDILGMMAEGKTAEDIAKMMADALNEATRIQEEEKKKDAVLAQKKIDAEDLADALIVFIDDYYPDLTEILAGFDISGRHIIEFLDGFVADKKTMKELKFLMSLFKEAEVQEDKNNKSVKISKTLSADEADMVVGNFLKKMGL
jgi:hypothetical protein